MGFCGDAIVEIAAGDLLGGFGEGLNGYGDAFGEKERDPRGGVEKKKGDEQEAEENFALE